MPTMLPTRPAVPRTPAEPIADGHDGRAIRRRRIAIAVALLVALAAGVAVAFFLATQTFRQSVVSQPLIVEVDGLEDVFGDDPRVQPWNLSEADERRVLVNSGEFVIRNPNAFEVDYALGSQFNDEVTVERTGADEQLGASTGERTQFDDLEVRACDVDAPASSGSLLDRLLGEGDAPTTSCTGFVRLSEIELAAGARPLDVARLAPGEERTVRLDLRLRDTRVAQRDDLRTLYDLVIEASGGH